MDKEALGGQRSPGELAEAFVRLGDYIKEPSPHPLLEESIEMPAIGIVGTIQIGQARSVPEELALKIRRIDEELLEPTDLTPNAKQHLLEVIKFALEQPMIGFVHVLEECGVDLELNKLGIFNPVEAPEVEKTMIRDSNPNPYLLGPLVREHEEKMDRWVTAYEAKHGKNPMED